MQTIQLRSVEPSAVLSSPDNSFIQVTLAVVLIWWVTCLPGTAVAWPTILQRQRSEISQPQEPEPLNAQQRADFYLNCADTRIATIEPLVDSVRDTVDLRQVPFQKLMATSQATDQIIFTLNLAREAIEALPASNTTADADELQGRYNRLARRMIRADEILTPARVNLRAQLNPKSFPDLKQDAARLRGFAGMVDDARIFESNPVLANDILAQLPAATLEFKRILQKYRLLIRQQTIAGQQLSGLGIFFDNKRQSFSVAAESFRSNVLSRLQQQIDVTVSEIQAADTVQRIAELIQGLPDRVQLIDGLQKLAAAGEPDDPNRRTGEVFLRQHLQRLTTQSEGRNVLAAGLPEDHYQGPDRSEIVAAVKQSHQQAFSNDTVLSVRVSSPSWTRHRYWRLNATEDLAQQRLLIAPDRQNGPQSQWHQIDRSYLKCYLVVTDSADESTVRVHSYQLVKHPPQQSNLQRGQPLSRGITKKTNYVTDVNPVPFLKGIAIRFDRPDSIPLNN